VSEPDLFVVCKNCSSEVSPYVTECPYCGQRVRKRAPKIERGRGPESEVRPRLRRRPSLGRLRRNEIPGIAVETRPYATGVVILASLALTVVLSTGRVATFDLGAIYGSIGHEWWRIAAAPFVYSTQNPFYEFVCLVSIGVFGTLIERRFGPAVAILIVLLAGAGGAALSVAAHWYPTLGGNGIALGLLAAWLVDDRLAGRRGDDRDNDLLGVWVFAALLLLLPVAERDASFFAGIGGAGVGALLGAVVSPFRP
jgi:membrane associated rhomboid family serine protease